MSEQCPEPQAIAESIEQYLTFELAKQLYAVEVLSVQEIQVFQATTSIPNAPDFVLGVINLRGDIVPIIDLRQRFGIEPIQQQQPTVTIIVTIKINQQTKKVGLVVDAVAEVHDILLSEQQPVPSLTQANEQGFIKRLIHLNQQLVTLLDLPQIVAFD